MDNIIDPGEGYRLLDSGETLCSGDEYRIHLPAVGTRKEMWYWTPVQCMQQSGPKTIYFGSKDATYRRKV